MSTALLIVIRDPVEKSLTSQTIYFAYPQHAELAKEEIDRQYTGSGLSVRITILQGAEA